MAGFRLVMASLALAMALGSCQSVSQKAANDQVKVVQGAELVCSARNDVDQAVSAVNGLTSQSTVGQAEQAISSLEKALKTLDVAEEQLSKAEFREYRDQVKIFRDAVVEVRSNKALTLAAASEQLKGKAEPLIAAREQLMAITVCIDIEEQAAGKQSDQPASEN